MVEIVPTFGQVQKFLNIILNKIRDSHYYDYLNILNSELVPFLIEIENYNLLHYVKINLEDLLYDIQFLNKEKDLIKNFILETDLH